ncbi:hypothetical protein PILCRDRAFT_73146 [Piloderma croceum F 1598]|uniref:CDR ABC transporter domain-containing protein n=1 Tax=Piloderma croceum (strain F 1598) TaxID=765440 RepID=A0A0C3B2F9_PILCF|nr:hypothetical protein PILCRDRAFT_73146 [Piloderma croceum F 1598]
MIPILCCLTNPAEYSNSTEWSSLFQSFWWPNTSLLSIFFIVFTMANYLILHFFVKER